MTQFEQLEQITIFTTNFKEYLHHQLVPASGIPSEPFHFAIDFSYLSFWGGLLVGKLVASLFMHSRTDRSHHQVLTEASALCPGCWDLSFHGADLWLTCEQTQVKVVSQEGN